MRELEDAGPTRDAADAARPPDAVADARPNDAAPPDRDAPPATGASCGDETCDATELCVTTRTGAVTRHACESLAETGCEATSCGCLKGALCGHPSNGTCMSDGAAVRSIDCD